MTVTDLLELITCGEKLQKFIFNGRPRTCHTSIDVKTFKKLVQIIDQRSEKLPLTLTLDQEAFIVDIPAEITAAASHLLTLELKIE